MRVESNSRLLWFCITTLSDWLKNLAPLSQAVTSKTKTNRDLLTQVFPRFDGTMDCSAYFVIGQSNYLTLVMVLRHLFENCSILANHERHKTTNWTNQNLKQVHVARGKKRGKPCASKSRLVLVLLLIGWKSGASFFLSQQRTSRCKLYHGNQGKIAGKSKVYMETQS